MSRLRLVRSVHAPIGRPKSRWGTVNIAAAPPSATAEPAAAGALPDGPFGRRLGTSFGGRRPFGAPGRARRRQRRQLGGWLDRFHLAVEAVELAEDRPDLLLLAVDDETGLLPVLLLAHDAAFDRAPPGR